MNIQAKKLELVQRILNTDKPSLLEKISKIFEQESETDWWDELSDEERASIQEGLDQLDRGEGIPHEKVMKEIKAKYGLK
jgi:thiamine pyrophosphate-dependent acetolactate synthase large subunit-like protein